MAHNVLIQMLERLVDEEPMGKVFVSAAMGYFTDTILSDEEKYRELHRNSVFNPDAMIRVAKKYKEFTDTLVENKRNKDDNATKK